MVNLSLKQFSLSAEKSLYAYHSVALNVPRVQKYTDYKISIREEEKSESKTKKLSRSIANKNLCVLIKVTKHFHNQIHISTFVLSYVCVPFYVSTFRHRGLLALNAIAKTLALPGLRLSLLCVKDCAITIK